MDKSISCGHEKDKKDDVISRAETLKTIGKVPDYGDGMVFEAISHAQRDVALLPAVDAVPVIRCRDCKHFDLDHWETINGIPLIVAHEICTFWGGGCKTDAGGYCFKGERREE